MHPIENQTEILRVDGLKKVYRSGQTDLVLFENLSFRVTKGEMLAIVGESGAGKSSLLHILGALDRASGTSVGGIGHEGRVDPAPHARPSR